MSNKLINELQSISAYMVLFSYIQTGYYSSCLLFLKALNNIKDDML